MEWVKVPYESIRKPGCLLYTSATRLRFNLADDSKADEAKVKAVKGVMGVRNQGGQFQVIIGQDDE